MAITGSETYPLTAEQLTEYTKKYGSTVVSKLVSTPPLVLDSYLEGVSDGLDLAVQLMKEGRANADKEAK